MTIYGKGIGNVTGLAYMPGNRRASLPDDGRMPGSRPLPANHIGLEKLMSAKLKRCPFCGGKAVMFEGRQPDPYNHYSVLCWDCRSGSNQYKTEKEAFDAWNKRYTETSVDGSDMGEGPAPKAPLPSPTE